MRILITGGGCREYIDSVRVVTNSSTGRTSAELSDELSLRGNEVTLITAESAIKPAGSSIKMIFYQTGEELAEAVKKELTSKPYDAVIHAAAVSDFVPDKILTGGKTFSAGKNTEKLPSGEEMTVTFRASPKIADSLRKWAGEGWNLSKPAENCGACTQGSRTPGAKIICFKLLNKADAASEKNAVTKLFNHSGADYVVYNDLSRITKDTHPFVILTQDGKEAGAGNTNRELAAGLLKILE